jgi:hypothetical protein
VDARVEAEDRSVPRCEARSLPEDSLGFSRFARVEIRLRALEENRRILRLKFGGAPEVFGGLDKEPLLRLQFAEPFPGPGKPRLVTTTRRRCPRPRRGVAAA